MFRGQDGQANDSNDPLGAHDMDFVPGTVGFMMKNTNVISNSFNLNQTCLNLTLGQNIMTLKYFKALYGIVLGSNHLHIFGTTRKQRSSIATALDSMKPLGGFFMFFFPNSGVFWTLGCNTKGWSIESQTHPNSPFLKKQLFNIRKPEFLGEFGSCVSFFGLGIEWEKSTPGVLQLSNWTGWWAHLFWLQVMVRRATGTRGQGAQTQG